MPLLRLSHAARTDIVNILAWSQANFGDDARHRYEALIAAGIRQVVKAPGGPGVRERPELGPGVQSWHLRQSKHDGPREMLVRHPRHVLIFRQDGDVVVIGRILHESMQADRLVDAGSGWS